MEKTYLFLFLLVSGSVLNAPAYSTSVTSSPNVVGSNLEVKLGETEETLKLSLWVPESNAQTPLPLLVVIDGQRYFNYAINMHHMAMHYEWTPKFAILGIDTSSRRWPTLMGKRRIILDTLKNQVFPHLQNAYPIGQERILFGWEAAGGFTLRTLVDEPELFSGYIAASPSPLFGDYFPTLKDDHERMVDAISGLKQQTHLYVAAGRYDYPQQMGIDTLAGAVQNVPETKLRQKFITIEDASHASLGFEALLKGIRDYFFYYDKPIFTDIDTFHQAGGNEYLNNYFKLQAETYGFEQQQLDKNRFEALRKLSFMILIDDDVEQMKHFLQQQGDDFLARSHLNHIYAYGTFMLKHNELNQAESLFQYLKARHPEHARPVNGLGLVAKARGEDDKAASLFKQAVDMGTKNEDFRLPEYQQNLGQPETAD